MFAQFNITELLKQRPFVWVYNFDIKFLNICAEMDQWISPFQSRFRKMKIALIVRFPVTLNLKEFLKKNRSVISDFKGQEWQITLNTLQERLNFNTFLHGRMWFTVHMLEMSANIIGSLNTEARYFLHWRKVSQTVIHCMLGWLFFLPLCDDLLIWLNGCNYSSLCISSLGLLYNYSYLAPEKNAIVLLPKILSSIIPQGYPMNYENE